MAATVPYSGYGGLIWKPRDSLANPSVGDLGKMRFDDKHYLRAYNQCRGRGIAPSICMEALPGDAHITPQNPLPTQFSKEIVDAVECMADTGDVERCQHYFEGLHKKVNFVETEKPGTISKTVDTVVGSLGLLGSSAPFAAGAAALFLQGLRLKF
ncbi:unnamed protein product [Amoebophrya sp. A120]|nr:unnamed protein product [Amoebophrya sp. A120]|eukprot:GSA120T00025411001.1